MEIELTVVLVSFCFLLEVQDVFRLYSGVMAGLFRTPLGKVGRYLT